MIPKPPESIAHICARIAADLLPKASDEYAGADLAFLTVMLSLVAQDFERFSDVHVREHEETIALIRGALDRMPEALRARADAILAEEEPGFSATALSTRADTETRLLIDMHAWIETLTDAGDAWAAQTDRAIWAFLDRYAMRRAYQAPL